MTQYFSADAIWDSADSVMEVYTLDGFEFAPNGPMAENEVMNPGLLTADLALPSNDLCEVAVSAEGDPTLFWVLTTMEADDSMFEPNDVLKLSLDKNMFNCVPGKIAFYNISGESIGSL